MYKLINKELPTPISVKFKKNCDIHNYNMRQAQDIHIQQANTQKLYKSIIYQGPDLWSKLDADLKNKISIKTFNYKVKQMLLGSY